MIRVTLIKNQSIIVRIKVLDRCSKVREYTQVIKVKMKYHMNQ